MQKISRCNIGIPDVRRNASLRVGTMRRGLGASSSALKLTIYYDRIIIRLSRNPRVVATGKRSGMHRPDVMHMMEGGPPRRLEVSLLAFSDRELSGRCQNRSWCPVQHTLSDSFDQVYLPPKDAKMS